MVSAACLLVLRWEGISQQSENHLLLPLPLPPLQSRRSGDPESAQTIPPERLGPVLATPPWSLWSRPPPWNPTCWTRVDAAASTAGGPIRAAAAAAVVEGGRYDARRGEARRQPRAQGPCRSGGFSSRGPVAPWPPDDGLGMHHLREAVGALELDWRMLRRTRSRGKRRREEGRRDGEKTALVPGRIFPDD